MKESIQRTRRIYVTPTLNYYYIPDKEISNRVIRDYRHIEDNFLRVAFVDEDINKCYYSQGSNRYLINHVRDVLENGVRFGTRTY